MNEIQRRAEEGVSDTAERAAEASFASQFGPRRIEKVETIELSGVWVNAGLIKTNSVIEQQVGKNKFVD